jgi:novobiocin biosynthesis protein NovU/D-mycarose 3-C-methyltransferase
VRSVLGIDPAANLASIATKNGINTHCALWGKDTAEKVKHYHPDLILARHVFAHIDDWKEFVDSLAIVAGRDTLIAIEVPDAVSMIRGLEFDTLYHEHLSYVTLESVKWLLRGTPFHISGVMRYEIHGGSIMIYIRNREYGAADLEIEREVELEDWHEFATKSCMAIGNLKAFVVAERSKGKRICGYGASAKSTVMLNACHLDSSHVSFICDGTSYKQWKKSPGTGIPIVDEGALLRELPDYAIIFAWNFHREIVENNKLYLEKGGHFVVPIPEITVI